MDKKIKVKSKSYAINNVVPEAVKNRLFAKPLLRDKLHSTLNQKKRAISNPKYGIELHE